MSVSSTVILLLAFVVALLLSMSVCWFGIGLSIALVIAGVFIMHSWIFVVLGVIIFILSALTSCKKK